MNVCSYLKHKLRVLADPFRELLRELFVISAHSVFLQLRKVERDKKTMDQEIVELTNKLVDAKNTIDKLEELNVCRVWLCVCVCVRDQHCQCCRTTIGNHWS